VAQVAPEQVHRLGRRRRARPQPPQDARGAALAEKATGIAPEFDATALDCFRHGHDLEAFRDRAMEVIGAVRTELVTDQDFADTEKSIK
jgi:hypothetical protein